MDLTPASVNICTTQNQTMVCKVVDENYNVSDIVFELNDDRVDASDVETVDNQTAKIQLRNLRQDDNNLNVLCCVDNCSTVDGYDSVSVQVYGKILIFSSTGRRPGSLCHGPLSVVRPSVLTSTTLWG